MGFAEFSFPCSLLGYQELLLLFSPELCSEGFLGQNLPKSHKHAKMVPIYWYLLMKSNGSAHATPNYALYTLSSQGKCGNTSVFGAGKAIGNQKGWALSNGYSRVLLSKLLLSK